MAACVLSSQAKAAIWRKGWNDAKGHVIAEIDGITHMVYQREVEA
jgi:hypothetical protein